jgi:hypothetical protein
MYGSARRKRSLRRRATAMALAGGLVLTSGAVTAAPGAESTLQSSKDGPPAFRIQMGNLFAAALVESAAMGARHRLEKPACQEIFADFADTSGRPLQESLDALGQTGGSYLGLIFFAEGDGAAGCRSRRVSAFTTPGSRVVFICGREFSAVRMQDSRHAQIILIHETLHSLGLSEDPPSSLEITAQVYARCGR